MTKITVVTFGKGGVGKTTTSVAFFAGPALRGHKTAIIDSDVGLRNLDLIMGCERYVVYDLINVVRGEADLDRALIRDRECENPLILLASQTRNKDTLTREDVEKVIGGLKEMGFEYIVCDPPAGIESGALMAMYLADEAIVVTNLEASSVRDSDRILDILSSRSYRAMEGGKPVRGHLLLTRYSPKRVPEGEILSLADIQGVLRIRLIGVIPESETVLQASNQGLSAICLEGSGTTNAYRNMIDHFLGKEKGLHYVEHNKPGFLQRLFGGEE